MLKVLNEQGYSLRGIGDTAWLGIESASVSSKAVAQTVEGYDANLVALQNTIIAPFVQYDGTASAKVILGTFEYIKDEKNITPNSATFNIVYVCAPHQPFLFDENGKSVQATNYNNWNDPRYYLGQYVYVMNEISQLADIIVRNDPDSVIIIASDHGPRFKEGMPYEDKLSVLNAVYYRGEDISEIEGKSGVNTLRTILDKLFDYGFQDLEVRDGE